MAGVTDVAFRLLCRKYGAGLAVTEMISASALARGNRATLSMIDVVPEEKPRVIQLFGQNTTDLVLSAKLCANKCEIIDLNFGCPAAKVIRQGAGSALLARPSKVKEIVQAVSSAVDIPITCKIRLGINSRRINVLKIAQICEEAGVSMITVHARTQRQGYTGKADWKWIKAVKEKVSIPVAGNGDVKTVEDYARMKRETNCDLVMIGRGAIGNPYLFRQIKDYQKYGRYTQGSLQQQLGDFLKYFEFTQKYKVDINNIRFHAQSFTKGISGSNKLRNKLSRMKTLSVIKKEMGALAKK
ncbi:tRNA dihydrouridine synthase DusB [Candidatus Woesearchaeota archaeon]|nr:tRNA dihydrouridine synthase DusB [Candidatus Woesearchaeota archaeon]